MRREMCAAPRATERGAERFSSRRRECPPRQSRGRASHIRRQTSLLPRPSALFLPWAKILRARGRSRASRRISRRASRRRLSRHSRRLCSASRSRDPAERKAQTSRRDRLFFALSRPGARWQCARRVRFRSPPIPQTTSPSRHRPASPRPWSMSPSREQ